MLPSGSDTWRKEVEDYEARMFEYFTQCSARLRDWYDKGGEDSDSYRAEYQRISEEYQRYMVYIQQLHEYVTTSMGSAKDSLPNDVAQPSDVNGNRAQSIPTPVSTSASSVARNSYQPTTAAAFYTQYYQEMITYFDKLLKTIEITQQNGKPSSKDEANEKKDDKTMKDSQVEDEYSDSEADPTIGGDMCCNPRAVMEQYFERYGEPGKWDWASWNNYLSWIARTNPQWYGIFLEYSQTLGIDWDEMYKCWRLSDAAGQGDTNVSGMAYQNSNGFPSELPHVRLFSNLPNYNDDDDGSDELFCRTCNMQLVTKRAFMLHLRGVTHIQKALDAVQQQYPQRFFGWSNYRPIHQTYPHPPPSHPLPPPPACQYQQRYEDEKLRHQAWLQSQYWQQNNTAFVVPGTLYCDLCKVNSATYCSLQAHLNGRRHRENVDIYYRTGEASMLKGKRGAHAKPTARLQTLLDMCTAPLVGLGYIVERQFGDEEDCIYLCELCDERITRQTAIKHVSDVVHRVNYMKLHYPAMCAIVVNDQSSRDIRLRRIELFARKIEDFEGRKRVKVKHLSAFDALRRIWRPLACEEVEKPNRKRITRRKQTVGSITRKSSTKKVKVAAPEHSSSTVIPVSNDVKMENGLSAERGDNISKAEDSDGELEEGEITEDSSDENTSFDVNSHDNSQWALRTRHSLMADRAKDGFVESNGLDHDKNKLDSSAELLEEEAFLPESILAFEPDAECLAYVDELRSGGFLHLGSVKKPDSTTGQTGSTSQQGDSKDEQETLEFGNGDQIQNVEKQREDTPSMEEQFIREADWVLERTRLQREQEEEYRRQLNSTTGAFNSITDSRGLRDDVFVDQEDDERWFDNGAEDPFTEENGSQNQLLLPSLGTAFGPGPNTVAPFDNSNAQPESSCSANRSSSTSTSVNATMDPERQNLAVSIGAVKIIVSALNALRDAGQLPGYLNGVFNKSGKQASGSSSTTMTASGKEDLISRTSEQSGAVGTVPRPNPIEMVQMPVAKTDTGSAILHHGSESQRMSNVFPVRPIRNEGSEHWSGIRSPFIPIPPGGLNPSLLGPPGRTVVPRPIGPPHHSRPQTLVSRARLESPPPNRFIRPHMPLPSISGSMDGPRFPVSGPMMRTPQIRPPIQFPPPTSDVLMDGISDLPPKVASYIRSDVNIPPETMFDAYALFSRRNDERNRSGPIRQRLPVSLPPILPVERHRFGRQGARVVRPENKKGMTGGRKLSAIADFLGVNEPPPVRPKAPPIPPDPQPPIQLTTVTASAIPYFAPVPNFSQSTVPRISLYLPQMNTPTVPVIRPSTTSVNSGITTGVMVPTIPSVYNAPAMLPTITNKTNSSLLGAPANLDEFLRKLRST